MDCCRVCIGNNINMVCLFDTSDIVDKIYFCTGIELAKDDGLPTKICNICLENLSIAYEFKNKCLQADKTLRSVVKVEKEDTQENFCFIEINEMSCESETVDVDVKQDLIETNDVTDTKSAEEKLESKAIIRKSSRVKLKDKNECGKEKDIQSTVRKKRGPYKTGVAKRPRKFKLRKLYCEPCDLKFISKEQSDEHRKDTHKSNDSFVCEICGKTFVHRASHYTHVRSHLPPRHGCGQCDYRTWHKHDLVKHLRIHTGVKMYQCEYCTASYHTSSNLTCHIRRCHMRERRHRCHLCDRSFYDRTKLNRHLDSHNDIKRFECDVCHACFTRRCYWKKHLQRQHGVTVPPQRPGRQKTNRQVGEDRLLPKLGT